MGKTIVLISSKGGSGKSTIAVGLATAFSKNNNKVLLIDADEGARCLDAMLSVNSDTLFDIGDVLAEDCDWHDALISVSRLNGIKLIPSPILANALNFTKLKDFVNKISMEFDYCIIDTKGQLPADRLSKLSKNFQFISVVTTDSISIRNMGIINNQLSEFGISSKLIINRFRPRMIDGNYVNIDNIIDESKASLIGIVPEDINVSLPKAPMIFGKASSAVFRIASRIDGNILNLPEIKNII